MSDDPGLPFAELGTYRPDYRLEGLRAAALLYSGRHDEYTGEMVLHAAGEFTNWLSEHAARLTLTVSPITFEQGHPVRHHHTQRTGENMAVQLTDTQQVSYAVAADDSKGFAVADTLTWSEDSNGAVVALTASADGSSAEFVAVAPGAAQITVTDGTLTASDTINVTAGAVASLVLTPGTPEDVPPVAPVAGN